jgi:hypothetical protein
MGPLKLPKIIANGIERAHQSTSVKLPMVSNGPSKPRVAFHPLHGNGCPRRLWHSNSVLCFVVPDVWLVVLHCGRPGTASEEKGYEGRR